jgi:N-acetyl-gamma-glutamyl-phosphate reductase
MMNAEEMRSLGLRVIDMSGAFRLSVEEFEKWYGMEHAKPELLEEAVYGMPALFKERIKDANLVANPGCYPTSVILPLHPIQDLIVGEATVVSTSGNSGARRTVEDESNDITYSFGRRHKHVPEMRRYSGVSVNFTPIVLRSVFRGINTNIRVRLNDDLASLSEEEAVKVLEDRIRSAYEEEDLVFVVRDTAEKSYGTKDINNTNRLVVKVRVDDGHAYINSLVDNLGKGAASQAVENMNLMLGLPRFNGIEPAYKCL